MERLLLLDGNGLIYRGYFALIEQPLTTSKGELVTAVFGFTNIVLRAIQDVQPDRVAIAFDLPARTFRHDRYAEYKATRTRMPDDMREQIPKVKQVVRAMNIPEYEQEGFEADDAIATLVGQAEDLGFDTTILTGDLDMLQLVSEHTKLMVSLRGGIANTVAYDLAKIEERWGLRPEQMLDYKSLKGDPTDNIPGIPGVGEKTASKLISTWGTLDALYEHIDEVTPEKLRVPLEEHRESVLESRELMRLVRDVDVTLDPTRGRVGEYDRQEVVRLFREFEFRTLIDRLPPLVGERPEDAVAAMRALREAGFPAAQGAGRAGGGRGGPVDPGELQLSMDFDVVSGGGGAGGSTKGNVSGIAATSPAVEARAEALAAATGDLPGALAAAIVDPGRIEIVEADGVAALEPWLRGQAAVGTGLVVDDPRPLAGAPLSLAVAGDDGRVIAADGVDASIALRKLLESVDARLVGHDVKPLLTARFADDPSAAPLTVDFDTQIAAYLVNAALRAQKIADVVGERLDLVLPPAAAGLPPVATAGLEALSSLAVRPSLEQALRDEGVDRLFAEVELPLIPILARMEAAGIALDRAALAELEREFAAEISRFEAEIYAAVGHEFTIGSPEAAGRHPVRRAGPPQGPPDEDRLLDRRVRARGAARRAPGDRADPRVAHLHQAPLDLRRGAADAHRARRPAPHAVPPGRGGDRAAVVVGPQPPEHPDPDPARPADPACLRRGLARHDARRRRLQPDRAPDPRPRVRRRAPRRRVRARGRHPPRDRGPRAAQGRPRTSRPTSGRWPRWSTSGSPTG